MTSLAAQKMKGKEKLFGIVNFIPVHALGRKQEQRKKDHNKTIPNPRDNLHERLPDE